MRRSAAAPSLQQRCDHLCRRLDQHTIEWQNFDRRFGFPGKGFERETRGTADLILTVALPMLNARFFPRVLASTNASDYAQMFFHDQIPRPHRATDADISISRSLRPARTFLLDLAYERRDGELIEALATFRTPVPDSALIERFPYAAIALHRAAHDADKTKFLPGLHANHSGELHQLRHPAAPEADMHGIRNLVSGCLLATLSDHWTTWDMDARWRRILGLRHNDDYAGLQAQWLPMSVLHAQVVRTQLLGHDLSADARTVSATMVDLEQTLFDPARYEGGSSPTLHKEFARALIPRLSEVLARWDNCFEETARFRN